MLWLQVRALKEKIEEEKGKDSFPAAGQKLIYAGLLAESFFAFVFYCSHIYKFYFFSYLKNLKQVKYWTTTYL